MRMKYGLPPTCETCTSAPMARSTSGSAATCASSSSDTALNVRSDDPFCATMKSESYAFRIAPAVCFSPPTTAPSATTVVMPMAIPSTVSAVRIFCRTTFFTISATNVTASVPYASSAPYGHAGSPAPQRASSSLHTLHGRSCAPPRLTGQGIVPRRRRMQDSHTPPIHAPFGTPTGSVPLFLFALVGARSIVHRPSSTCLPLRTSRLPLACHRPCCLLFAVLLLCRPSSTFHLRSSTFHPPCHLSPVTCDL